MDKTSDEELIRLKIANLSNSMEQLGGGASGILFLVTQLKAIQKRNEMVEANIKSRSEELALKEKELQALSSDLDQKVEAFEKEKSEAGDLKKLVEELTAKLDTSSRVQREIEVRKKMVQSLNNEIDSKSEESREMKRVIEQQTGELVVLQKQRDSIRSSSSEMEERARDKEKDLELLKSQIESEEKKLIQLKREMELTLSKIEESVQQLADVNEKLESQRRQLEKQSVEQVSKHMELESLGESSKRFMCDLEVKEKRLEELNNLIKISGEQLDSKSKELGEIERELKFKRRLRGQMSTVLVKRERQPVSDRSQRNLEEEVTEPIDTLMLDGISASLTCHEVSSVLRASPNPAEFVLELVQDDIREGVGSFQDTFLETLVLLFEELAKIQQPDNSQLLKQLQATEVATLWKERITIKAPESTLEALAFLLFVVAYGLKTLINEEETAFLVSSVAQYKQAPALFGYLSLNPMIRELVKELIKKSLYIPAVRLICLFKLDKEVSFSPSELLKKEIVTFRRSALENRSTESSQAKEKDGGRLRAILELVADYKLEIDLPGDLIAKLMVEGERSAPVAHCSVKHVTSSSNPQAGLQKKQLGQVKTVLLKHTGVDEENLGTTLAADVNPSNERSNPKHLPIIHTYQRRRN